MAVATRPREVTIPEGRQVIARMCKALDEVEHSRALYFRADGKRLGEFANGIPIEGAPKGAVFVIDYPFRPSALSLADMLLEHERTGRRVTYDQPRWEDDLRIEQQAGPCATTEAPVEVLMGAAA